MIENTYSDPRNQFFLTLLAEGNVLFQQELCPPYNFYEKLHIAWTWYKFLSILSRGRHRYLEKKENGYLIQNGNVTGKSTCNDSSFTLPYSLLIDYSIHLDFYHSLWRFCLTHLFKTNKKLIFSYFFLIIYFFFFLSQRLTL